MTGEAGDGSDTLVHGYFVGTAGGDCALIYVSPASRAHAEALAAAAPGHVRWLLSTQAPSEDALRELWPDASAAVPAPGEQIRIGDATLRVLPGDGDAQSRRFLLVEEGLLFTGASDAPAPGEGQGRWIAPRQGFLHSRR